MAHQWEYCTMVVTDTQDEQCLFVTYLKAKGRPEGRSVGAPTLGGAIAQLGAEGWEMCGLYAVSFPNGMGQQFFFKRVLNTE